MGFGSGYGFAPVFGDGGGGSITWNEFQVGYGIDGSDVISNSDFTYHPSALLSQSEIGFDGNSYFVIRRNGIIIDIGDNSGIYSGSRLEIQTASAHSSLGDVDDLSNGTLLMVDDGSRKITLNTKNATIGREGNFPPIMPITTGQFSLGLISIPDGSSSVGVYNVLNSGSNDLGLSGVGDLSFVSLSTDTSFLMRVNGDGSMAYIAACNKNNKPVIETIVENSDNSARMLIGLDQGEWICLGGANGTSIEVNDDNQLISISNVPSYLNDAAAVAAGLLGGDLYNTTSAGSTYIKLRPYP